VKHFSPDWVRWLFQTYVGLAIMTLGCVLMALGALGDVGAYVAVGGVIWFGISYLLRPVPGPYDDDGE
jgi:uncharacterized membrane protein